MAALIDNSTKIASKDNTSTLQTPSFAVGGSNRVLWALAYSGAGSPVVATAGKWGGSGGTSMSIVASTTLTFGSGGNGVASLWRLIAPTAQTSTVWFDWGTNQDERLIIAVSTKDTDQGTPNGTVATGLSSSLTPALAATAVVGDLVLNFMAVMGGNADPKTLTAAKTTLQEIEGTEGGTLDGYECLGAQYTTAASTSESMGWTVGGSGADTNWVAQWSFAVNGAGGGGGSPLRRNSQLNGLGASGPFFHNPLG